MKPICVPCERFMRPKKTGYRFVEGMPGSSWDKGQGKNSVGWMPYKIWEGDLWCCPDCGAQIVVGTGAGPIAVRHETDFAAALVGAEQLLVKDC